MEITFGLSLEFRTDAQEAAASRQHGPPIEVLPVSPSEHRCNMVPRCSTGGLDLAPTMPRSMRISDRRS